MHQKPVPSFAKRSPKFHLKNTGSGAMGTTIQTPMKMDKEPRMRSRLNVPNPTGNVGRSSFNGYKHTSSLSGVKAEERAEEMGKC